MPSAKKSPILPPKKKAKPSGSVASSNARPHYPPNDKPKITDEGLWKLLGQERRSEEEVRLLTEDEARRNRKVLWAQDKAHHAISTYSAVGTPTFEELKKVLNNSIHKNAKFNDAQSLKGAIEKRPWLTKAFERCHSDTAQETWNQLSGFSEEIEYEKSSTRGGKTTREQIKGHLKITDKGNSLHWRWARDGALDPKEGKIERHSWDVTFNRFRKKTGSSI